MELMRTPEPDPQTVARSPRQITIENEALQRRQKRAAAMTILLPFAGSVAAVALAFVWPVRWVDIWLLVSMYVVTTLGVTVGFHRLFAHRAFKSRPALTVFLGIAGSMAAQGTPVYWVATHRRHHQFSEEDLDPHSPYQFEGTPLSRLRGLWHSHLGWMLDSRMTNTAKYAKDLQGDPLVAWINRHYRAWILLGLALPGAIGGLVTMSWAGALTGFLWGGPLRMFLAHHAMWTSGSTAHIFGTRPFETPDKSTNNALLALPNLGEAWHNNHHAFPSSAIFGLTWWQPDPGGWFIRACEAVGLCSQVRRPSPAMIAQKRRKDGKGKVEAW